MVTAPLYTAGVKDYKLESQPGTTDESKRLILETANLLWMTGGLAFFTGLVMGMVINHLLGGSRTGSSQLRKQLDKAEAELNEYKEKVADHFSTTAHLVNRMTESYRDVHEHMAASANDLCTDELTRQRLNDALLGSNTLLSGKSDEKTSDMVEPPKDYALKSDPAEAGTLADNFGMDSTKKAVNNA